MRRDGEEAVYISPLRFGDAVPGLLRRPLTADTAATAAFAGRAEYGQWSDYRGERVLAAGARIPAVQGWAVVAQIGEAEALSAHHEGTWALLAGGLAILLAALGVGAALYQRQRLRNQLAIARREAQLGHLLEHAADAIVIARSDGQIIRANEQAARLYGYTQGELLNLRLQDFYPPDQHPQLASRMQQIRERGHAAVETVHRSRDGRLVEVEIAARFLELDEGNAFVSIIRDVGERRKAEREIAALNRVLRTLTEINELMVREVDRERLLTAACEILVAQGGFRMAWVGFVDPQTRWVVPAAWAGHEEGYLSASVYSTDPRLPQGRGPLARCVRESRTIYIPDLRAEETFSPWRSEAESRGYVSVTATPLRMRGEVVGAIGLFSAAAGEQTPAILKLVEELADDIGFALEAIEARRERDEARDRLLQSRDFLQTLVDSSEAPIYTLTPDGRVGAVWNAAAERLFGWSREEVVGRPLPIVPAERQDEFRALTNQLRSGQRMAGLEVSRVRRDGRAVELSLAASPIRDGEGKVSEILAVAIDITALKQAEAALRESELRYKRLAENAPDVIFRQIVRPALRTEYISPVVQRDLGYAPQEFYDDPQLLRERLSPKERWLLDRAVRGTALESTTRTVRCQHRDGQYRWFEVHAVNVRDNSGQVIAIEGIARDVTDRLRVERALRQLSAAVEQNPVAVVITDLEGTIEYVNPAFSRQTGFSREEAVGQNPRILKSGHHPPEFYANMYATLARGLEFRGEMLNRRKTGELYWEYAVISAIEDADGLVTHYVGVKEDVTPRKQAEERLRQTQEQLALSQRLEAIGRLAGGVAHDFNNLLGVIIGRGEMVEAALADAPETRRQVAQILAEAHRAADLTRQLLAFSRKQVLQPHVIDLNEAMRGLEKLLTRLIGEDVTLEIELSRDIGHVRVDPGQLGQVVMNLAVNARDAMPRGGTLQVRTSNVEVDQSYARTHPPIEPGAYVQLTLTDTGEGMDESVRTRAFEPFFTTKPEGVGTGLGLATVYGIVKQSGGFIWIDSAPGQGTTFTIHLPRVDEPVEAAQPAAQTSAGGSETLMLVEDQDSLRQLLVETLTEAGYTVLEAADGPAAIRLAAEHPGTIHLLVSDVIMPGMNGRDLLDKLRQKRPGLRALFISGYTHDIIQRTGASLEGAHLLEKPFGRERLFQAVRRVLSDNRG